MESSKHPGPPGLANEVVLPVPVLAVPASTSLTSFGHSTAAPGSIVQDLFALQLANTALYAMVMNELNNIGSFDMPQAIADFLGPEDAAEGAADAGPAAAGKNTALLSDLAYHASVAERGVRKHDGDGPGNDAVGPVKKRSRKSVPAQVDEEPEVVSADEDSDSKGLTVEQIKEFYKEITNQSTKNRSFFKYVMKKTADKYKVSITSLRNIVSFKNRTGDSHPFWNDELWQLYNGSVRCETCRLSSKKGGRVLCPHFKIGRPPLNKTHKQLAVGGFRTLTAAAHPSTEKEGGSRKRGYLVQIRLAEVWACLGCTDSKKILLCKNEAGAPQADK